MSMSNVRGAVVAVLLVAAVSLTGCGGADAGVQPPAARGPAAGQKWNIVCTIGMVADIVRAVAGARADVTNIIGEGVDPHLYTTTRSDVTRLRQADIVFYSGLMLEGKMTDALVRAAVDGKKVYPVTDLIDRKYLLEPEEFAGHYDPHVWMDVRGWMSAVEAVTTKMIDIDPDGAEVYLRNTVEYLDELRRLESYARSCIESIPEKRRVLITAHDAFNYFGRAYGIEVLGIQGISTEAKAGVNDINRLVDMIVDRGVTAVFVETSVAEKNVLALVQGAAARGQSVTIGGSLFSDAMGAPGSYEGTYVGMIDHNVTTIARALGGTAPAGGLNDKLSAPTHGTRTP